MKNIGPVGSLAFLFSQKLEVDSLVAGQPYQDMSGVVNNHRYYSKTQIKPLSEKWNFRIGTVVG